MPSCHQYGNAVTEAGCHVQTPLPAVPPSPVGSLPESGRDASAEFSRRSASSVSAFDSDGGPDSRQASESAGPGQAGAPHHRCASPLHSAAFALHTIARSITFPSTFFWSVCIVSQTRKLVCFALRSFIAEVVVWHAGEACWATGAPWGTQRRRPGCTTPPAPRAALRASRRRPLSPASPQCPWQTTMQTQTTVMPPPSAALCPALPQRQLRMQRWGRLRLLLRVLLLGVEATRQ